MKLASLMVEGIKITIHTPFELMSNQKKNCIEWLKHAFAFYVRHASNHLNN